MEHEQEIVMYVTKSGDHWDMIAKKVYGSEKYADWLMQNNMEHLDVFRFDAGTELETPDMPNSVSAALPPWRAR